MKKDKPKEAPADPKPTGRNYVKKTAGKRLCVVCTTPYYTTHPKQKTCLREKCQDVLRQRNFDSFIERQAERLKIRRGIKMAEEIITKAALKEAQQIIDKKEGAGNGKH